MKALVMRREAWWSAWVMAALLLIMMAEPMLYGVAIPLSGLLLALVPGALPPPPSSKRRVDRLGIDSVRRIWLSDTRGVGA